MAEIPDVQPGEDVESSWGNTIRSRTVMRYADQVALDASIPFPVAGDLAYLADTDALQVYDGLSWGAVFFAGGATDGSAPGFAFTAKPDAGMYNDTADRVLFAVAGGEVLRLEGTGAIFGINVGGDGAPKLGYAGTVANPAYTFRGDTDMGMYRYGGNQIGWATVGVAAMRLADTSWFLEPKILDARFRGFNSFITSGSAANGYFSVGSDEGRLYRSTSARKYKTDIKALPKKLVKATLEPVSFKHEDGHRYLGFVADDVAALDKRLGVFGEDGEIENYDHRGVLALLVAQVNELRAEVKALKDG